MRSFAFPYIPHGSNQPHRMHHHAATVAKFIIQAAKEAERDT